MKKQLFTLLTLLLIGISGAWAADFIEKWTGIKLDTTGPGWVTTITYGSNASTSSSRIQIANNKTGSFTIGFNPTGYTIKSVKFLLNTNDSYITSFTSSQGSISKTATKEWTFTPTAETTPSSATFSIATTTATQIKELWITFTDGNSDTDYESLIPTAVTDGTATCTSTAATSYATITTSGTLGSSSNVNCIDFGSSGTVTVTCTKNIKYILMSWYQRYPSEDSHLSPSTGSFSASDFKWTPANTTTKQVTFTRTQGSSTRLSNIHIVYQPSCTSVAAPTDLTCSTHTKNSLTFGWTAAEHASKYTATLYSNSECTGDPVATTSNIATTSVTFSGLSGSTTYYCKVQSNGDGSTYCAEGNVTDAVSGTTDAKDYTVTAASNNALWGSAVADVGSLDEGETADVTATPESGYKFVSWAVSGEGASLSSTTTNPTTLTMGTANATVTATFRALYTYTITYDKGANGTGSIDAGEKTEDVAFTLSSSKFTRAGYVQTGWSLTDGGEKAYDLGGSYTTNAAQTFYPFWTELDAQTSISGYTKWNWADLAGQYTANSGSDLKLADDGKGDSKSVDVVMSNIPKYGRYVIEYPASFDAQSLLFNGEYPVRKQGSDYVAGATYIKFTTTVAGIVTVTYADNGSNSRFLRITDSEGSYDGDASTSTTDYKTFSHSVAAGEVKLAGYKTEETFIRFKTIIFQPTVTVSVGAKGYATYCNSDYALDFTDCSIQPYVIASTDGSTLTLTNKKKVAKNEPVLLYSSTNSDSKSVPAIADGDATAEATNKLVKGDNLAHTWVSGTAEHYVLATATVDPGFYRANNNTVASNKAYLDLTGLSGAHSFTLDLSDGAVTGIANVSSEKEMNNTSFYNLAGQKIAQPTKGLYIVNGKKVIIK